MVLILPLRAVLLQSLFLLVTIAIEAVILRWELRMPYKRSVQYAATLNLLSMVIGWLSFFLTLPILDARLLEDVISYVLFDRLPINVFLIVVGGFIAFMLSFLVKLYGLKGLDFILERQGPKPVEDAPPTERSRRSFTSPATRYRESDRPQTPQSSPRYAILLANAASYSAIAAILTLRILLITPNG
jgi:hypothetical protein